MKLRKHLNLIFPQVFPRSRYFVATVLITPHRNSEFLVQMPDVCFEIR